MKNKNTPANKNSIIQISPGKFLVGCIVLSFIIFIAGYFYTLSSTFIAVEVFLTIISLFILGSARYRLDKNAITYGASLVISATFWNVWWSNSQLRQSISIEGAGVLVNFLRYHLLTLDGLNNLFHADTMLFILGLTLFVSVIAQTRLLEVLSLAVLRKNKGNVVKTIAILMAVVAFSSGILDGVSMIGLMIRIMVMILFFACVKEEAIIYSIMVSTVVTTVCGMWLAYGEPPNLIMKANLHPYLNNAFFLRYCLPVAVGSYLIVAWNMRRKLIGWKVDIKKLDILDLHMADVRFLQGVRHGEMLIPTEFVDYHRGELGVYHEAVEKRLHGGESLGIAMVRESVPKNVRLKLLGLFVSENLAETLDKHYEHAAHDDLENSDKWAREIKRTLKSMRHQRLKAQWIGTAAFVPFVGLLVWHAFDHKVPLFLASFAGFLVALLGIVFIPKMLKLALHEARHEYKEYLFLIPLFFSIMLLQKTGFFNQLSGFLRRGIEQWGTSHVAYTQFVGATFLSAILDNNVVADFISRALHGLELGSLHLFAMAQIAGYATGGCWTHIGSAQSVIAYAFIRREFSKHYTPLQWIKAMTPIIVEIFILMTLVVYGEGLLLQYFK